MTELTDENFTNVIEDGVHVIDFWATWCGPCKMYGPIFTGVAESFKDDDTIHMHKADIDSVPGIATQLGITAVPSTVFIKDGEVVDKQVGSVPKQVLVNKLESLM